MLRNFTVCMCVRNSTICMKSCVENFSLLKAQTLINHQHLCPQTSPWEYGWTLYGLLTEVSTERSKATDENMQLPKAPATPLAEKPPGHFHFHVSPSPGSGQISTILLHVSQSALCFSWSFFQSKVCSEKMRNMVERNNQTDSEKQQQSLRTIRAYRRKREEEEEDSVDLSCMAAAAGAEDERTAPVDGRTVLFVCLHQHHLTASITVARKGSLLETQDSQVCPYPQFTSGPYCSCLHSGSVHSVLVAVNLYEMLHPKQYLHLFPARLCLRLGFLEVGPGAY